MENAKFEEAGGVQAPGKMGLLGATSVGIGAIVGGGILALAGVAFSTTGPGALLAFGLNGVIAILTALSFAEMATAFPQSGGTYNFARRVFSIEAAFVVGWVVWFASMVAAVLYALGFASFAIVFLVRIGATVGWELPVWLLGRTGQLFLAIAAIVLYTLGLLRRGASGGAWINIGKLLVFGILIGGGFFAFTDAPAGWSERLDPFLTRGFTGLVQAMGYTFIALQGFDLIAAVAGEVERPERNLPASMLLSLLAALLVYLPLLFVISTVGVPTGLSIAELSAQNPETVIANAAQNYLGAPGFWLVVIAALLSMLSALQANLFASSRVALAMARDRTLPSLLGKLHPREGTPVGAVLLSAATTVLCLFLLPDLAAAGAASSLIFLISFALVHGITILARVRSGGGLSPFRSPLFPLIPVLGGSACLALAIFQGLAVPAAGLIAVVWIGLGILLFLLLFGRAARTRDARTEAGDPQLVQLRGRSPLVLVPIANPASAESLIHVARALAPEQVGRALLLSVVSVAGAWKTSEAGGRLIDAQAVLGESMSAALSAGLPCEALVTVAPEPWAEIGRVAHTHRCESLLLGLGHLPVGDASAPLEKLLGSVDRDVVFLRAPVGWRLSSVRRVLIPIGGKGHHFTLRTRFLANLAKGLELQIEYLLVLPEGVSEHNLESMQRHVARQAAEEVQGSVDVHVLKSSNIAGAIAQRAIEADLVVLGLRRMSRRMKAFGQVPLDLARSTDRPLVLISSRG